MSSPIYTSYDGTKLTVDELKQLNIEFYQGLTSHRFLLSFIKNSRHDIKHILKTILESNSTYFVIGIDISDMDSTVVFSKVDLVNIIKDYSFSYGISYVDYYDYLLTMELSFDKPIFEFNHSNKIDVFLSYNDMEQIIKGINMDSTMLENWKEIQHWWKQKELFKNLE